MCVYAMTPSLVVWCISCGYFFQCGEKGHYANKCPKGVLAFLSNKNPNPEVSFLSDTPSDVDPPNDTHNTSPHNTSTDVPVTEQRDTPMELGVGSRYLSKLSFT